MKKMNKSPFAAAMGTAMVSTLVLSTAYAEANPFGMTELSSGYMQVAEAEMTCGEGKCGGMKSTPKMEEGKCAGKKEEKPAADKSSKEMTCGEGKCGGMTKPEGDADKTL